MQILISHFILRKGSQLIFSSPKKASNENMILQRPDLNVSTFPITAMGSRQCLSCSVVQLKGKNCRKPHCRNGVVDTIGPGVLRRFDFHPTTV